MILRQMIKYLFPRLKPREKLPLLPLRISSEHSVYGEPPAHLQDDLALLKGFALARTNSDAYRLMKHYPGVPVTDIIRQERRKRRREPRLKKAWRRLKLRW